jgi:hypothetical protein
VLSFIKISEEIIRKPGNGIIEEEPRGRSPKNHDFKLAIESHFETFKKSN